jgi:hypothetical protein
MAGSARPGKCTFISLVGGARLQSAAHPSSGLARFEVKWFSAIVFNDLQVGRWLAFGRRIAPSQCSIDSKVGFQTRRTDIKTSGSGWCSGGYLQPQQVALRAMANRASF